MTHIIKQLFCFVLLFFASMQMSTAQRQQCTQAQDILNSNPLSVPSVAWSPSTFGQRFACLQDSLHQPYWLKFTALTSGTFEFALTPKNLGADYDFVLFSEACPCDTTQSNVLACNWLGWVTQLFGPTGISSNPYKNFNVKDTIAWAEFEQTVQLKAGTNYYLLVDNITANGVGFDMKFGGTAQIGKTLGDGKPRITELKGNRDVCSGATEIYELIGSSQFTDYEWIIPNDANIIGKEKKVEITWGSNGGVLKVKAKTKCSQDSIQITVNGGKSIQLSYQGTKTICEGECIALNSIKINDLSGNSGIQYDFYDNSQDAFSGTKNTIIGDYICKEGIYWARGGNKTCFDTVQFEIQKTSPPKVTLLGGGVACPGDTSVICFQFEGKAPFKVNYTDGNQSYTITTNQTKYNVDITINEAINYKILSFTDATSACNPLIIGEARYYTPTNCICLKRAGTMFPAPINACTDIAAITQHNNDHQAGTTDALGFILHSTQAPELGTVYATSPNPQFSFISGLMYNKTYYISSVLGTKKADGSINLSDPCLGISAGVPVIFHEPPTALLNGDSTICKDQNTDLLLTPFGKFPFTLTLMSNGFSQEMTIRNQVKITGVPIGTYSISAIKDANGCTSINTDTLQVKAPKSLIIKNKKINCNSENTAFYVSFEVEDGDENTYYTVGQKGVFTKKSFKSTEYPSGATYIFMVKDANGCDSVKVIGTATCDCNAKSEPGTLDTTPLVVCEDVAITASYLNDAKLQNGHVLGFVLRDSSNNILAYQSNFPNFQKRNSIKVNYTYFIAAVAGPKDATNKVDLKSSCLSFSAATPVRFVEKPTATFELSGANICENDTIEANVKFQGIAPFSLIYTDGSTSQTINNIASSDAKIKISISKSVTYTLAEIKSSGTPGCKGTIDKQATFEAELIKPIVANDVKINCTNDKKAYTVSFELDGGGGNYEVNNSNVLGKKYESNAFADASTYRIEIKSSINCKPLILEGKGFCTCPPDAKLQLVTIIPISCNGQKNGILEVSTNIKPPLTYQWNTGARDMSIGKLKAGIYRVTVTNNDFCTLVDSIAMAEPELLSASIATLSPKCSDDKDGEIAFENIKGGIPPYSYSIDARSFQTVPIFDKLKPLTYQCVVKDRMGCMMTQDATIEQPEDFSVSLGGNQQIKLGETTQIRAIITGDYKNIKWSTPDFKNEIETITPLKSIRYEIQVESKTGCKVKDTIWINVQKPRDIYAPNTFSPNGDGVNDGFTLFTGKDVRQIKNFRIFDRWGTQIFSLDELKPNDEFAGWQGTYRNYLANAGVYTYSAEIIFIDERSETIRGDFQLVHQ